MVRVNLIEPHRLSDQHLIAEYNEILMLLGYVQRHPSSWEGHKIPPSYRLGPGHILFFKDKLSYLKKRHELLKKEMRKRGFKPTVTINLSKFPAALRNDWRPEKRDIDIIKARLAEKLRKRPEWYRYYSVKRSTNFFLDLLK